MIDPSHPSTWPAWMKEATRLAGPLDELDEHEEDGHESQ